MVIFYPYDDNNFMPPFTQNEFYLFLFFSNARRRIFYRRYHYYMRYKGRLRTNFLDTKIGRLSSQTIMMSMDWGRPVGRNKWIPVLS